MSLPTTIAIGSLGALAATGFVSMQDLPSHFGHERARFAPVAAVVVADTAAPISLRTQLPASGAQTVALAYPAIMTDAGQAPDMRVAQAGVPSPILPAPQARPQSMPKQAAPAQNTNPPAATIPAPMPATPAQMSEPPAAQAPVAPMPAPAAAEAAPPLTTPSAEKPPTPVKRSKAVAKPDQPKADQVRPDQQRPASKEAPMAREAARTPVGTTGSYASQVFSLEGIVAAEKALLAKTAFRATYQAHIASYATEEDAMLAWEEIAARAGSGNLDVVPRLVRIEIPERGSFVRLMAGDFASVDSSAAFCTRLRSLKVECRIMRDATHAGTEIGTGSEG